MLKKRGNMLALFLAIGAGTSFVAWAAPKARSPELSRARDDVLRAFATHFKAPKEQKAETRKALDAALNKMRGAVGEGRARSAEIKSARGRPAPVKEEASGTTEWVLDGKDVPRELVFPPGPKAAP